ncbi:hypothetical protein R6Y99_20950 [Pseudomonas lundensis]|uniref:hypothetical protein n=1 Tax=Serratia proteamaculans TaxID=28151 RepID=UPI0029820BCB|nr:hypothetical protein [Serratia proteamaculans]MDW5502267.1 hypothetical protein [Serratia proteamaculans]MDW5507325.1 hypothetical protein [Pseudomonas lundensis]
MKNNLVNQDIKTDKPLAMSYEALKADRDAQQKRADALAVENAALKNAITTHSQSTHFCELCGKDDPCSTDDVCYVLNETPATDAALAAIEARGAIAAIESLIGKKKRALAEMHPDTHAFGMTSALIRNQIRCLESFATELREGK